ncbi:MAG: ATP-dependent DNA helicase [Planctomycetes bacterium]|nr:ATP-dependent DNA helicase [Planctomycetota bacterium]
MPIVDPTFGPNGLLARRLPGYEPRDGQIEMARAVSRAVAEKKHLAIEAPCGVGKTFAYLVPAIEHAVRTKTRLVVCTANITLQEQLVAKDLPALSHILPFKFSFALIKGLGNYLCLDRLEEAQQDKEGLLFPTPDAEPWERLMEWSRSTKTGDLSELPFKPPEGMWNRVNGVSELCHGRECPQFEPCFAMEARRRLRETDVIVTNYHLFFAHLHVKIVAERDVILPPFSTLICDEAHEMADIARDFFGRRFSEYSITHLVRGAQFFGLRGLADALRSASKTFFQQVYHFFRSPEYRIRLRRGGFANGADLAAAVAEFKERLAERLLAAQDDQTLNKIAKFIAAADHYLSLLNAFLEPNDPNQVAWIEKETDRRTGATAARLMSRVVDVSGLSRDHVFKAVPSVILTSATLANGRTERGLNFEFLKRETGADAAEELGVRSPFDFRRQARLVIPPVAAGPNDPEFAPEIARSINQILRHLGGRTMALFTSYRNMRRCAEAAQETGVEILVQGQQPQSQLLKAFREDRGTALFATASFWQGVDVPGEALSCLVIDKIPFTPPEDPLLDALRERDPDCFRHTSLPRAIIELRQGFGRLIRTSSDRGVVVIFDNRLFTARYGRDILESLPDIPIHRDLHAVFEFFDDSRAPWVPAPDGASDVTNQPPKR